MQGLTVGTWFGVAFWWWELRAAMRQSEMVPTGDRPTEQHQERTMEPRQVEWRKRPIKPVSPSRASSVPLMNPVSYEHPAELARVRVPRDGIASHGLPTTSGPWSTQGTWTVVIGTDWTYYERMWTARSLAGTPVAFPEYNNERTFVLSGKQIRIGRRSAARGLEPDIDLTATSADPAVSRLHAVLIAASDGSWAVLDPGSANGTLLNGRKLAVGNLVPLCDGDRINLGAWTVITARREPQGFSPV